MTNQSFFRKIKFIKTIFYAKSNNPFRDIRLYIQYNLR